MDDLVFRPNEGSGLPSGEPAAQADALSANSLNDEERAMLPKIIDSIELNEEGITSFGASAQFELAKTSDTLLQNSKTKDLGAVGTDLARLVTEIKSFDASGSEGGFFGLFKKAKDSIARMAAGYQKVETNVDKIVSVLEGHKRQLYKDIAMLDEMYQANYRFFREISLYIVAGAEKLKQFTEVTIPAKRQEAQTSGDEMAAQRLNDMENAANRFEKRLHDLRLTRTISIQLAPQIRLLQSNDSALAEKIQSSIVNAIPLWKNQMVLALGLANSKAALEAQSKVTDMTNELLLKNSELLKQGQAEVARESERGIVSIETIRKTNENLIATINQVMEIQQKGQADRAQAESELAQIENELKQTLLDIRKR